MNAGTTAVMMEKPPSTLPSHLKATGVLVLILRVLLVPFLIYW